MQMIWPRRWFHSVWKLLTVSSLWHVCAALKAHSVDKGQVQSAKGIWFDAKNAKQGTDARMFLEGGRLLIRAQPSRVFPRVDWNFCSFELILTSYEKKIWQIYLQRRGIYDSFIWIHSPHLFTVRCLFTVAVIGFLLRKVCVCACVCVCVCVCDVMWWWWERGSFLIFPEITIVTNIVTSPCRSVCRDNKTHCYKCTIL